MKMVGKIGVHSPFYKTGSRYEQLGNNTYMYDYHCLLFPVLAILGFRRLDPSTLNRLYQLIKNKWTTTPGDEKIK